MMMIQRSVELHRIRGCIFAAVLLEATVSALWSVISGKSTEKGIVVWTVSMGQTSPLHA